MRSNAVLASLIVLALGAQGASAATGAGSQRLQIHHRDAAPLRARLAALAGEPAGRTSAPAGRPAIGAATQHCGTVTPDLATRERVQGELLPLLRAAEGAEAAKGGSRIVEVVFHVLHDGNEGLLSVDDLLAQIDVLNAAYAGTGLLFDPVWADAVDDPDFFEVVHGSEAEYVLKSALSEDWNPRFFLNIYTGLPYGPDGSPLLGYATFPWDLSAEPEIDGVVVNHQSLPGGQEPYDIGITTVHEVGHWLGLYHTFQGGCTGNGDYVKDTPAEARPDYECELGRDTCPSKGADSISNFMNYGFDWCLASFTKGQKTRLTQSVKKYRPLL